MVVLIVDVPASNVSPDEDALQTVPLVVSVIVLEPKSNARVTPVKKKAVQVILKSLVLNVPAYTCMNVVRTVASC